VLPFDPLSFPLNGQRLIEASAGTGKTFSIALLFLRLVLEQELDVDRILVITFTSAATEELRSRINERLREALHCLAHLDDARGQEPEEGVLVRLLKSVADSKGAEIRLADALARMDEAAVYTIHGFCQRMLQDNAFQSGSLFDLEFLESEKSLRSQIIEDFWRRSFYTSPLEEAEWALDEWGNPEGLEKSIDGMLSKPSVELVPAVSKAAVQQAKIDAEEYFRQVCMSWRACGRKVEEILRQDKCLSKSRKDGYCPERVDSILSWMEGVREGSPMQWVLPEDIPLLSSTVMRTKLIRRKICPEHVFFDQFDSFLQAHKNFLRAARFNVLAEAVRFLRSELDSRKTQQGRIFYDDLLVKLDRALARGGRGSELARHIRARYAAALIDEFQDTDPVQYRIVSRLFGQGQNPAFFMVGDPKQSIYSFRGADVFAYIKARRDTPEDGRFTMNTNYRSTGAMVRAVNTLFHRDDSFIFIPDIVFRKVQAAGKTDAQPLLLGEKTPRPLQVMLIPSDGQTEAGAAGMTKKRAEEIATRWSAYEIARLLAGGAEGRASIANRSLTGGDVAVLVRTHIEARLMQEALTRLEIASVYYSQDSVFATDEAKDLYRVLLALLDPGNEKALRSALVTDLFGINGTGLYLLLKDDDAREKRLAEFHEYRTYWHRNGLMAMFQMLLAGQQTVQRLLTRPAGERKLTNYLHLAELLQDESEKTDGPESLIRWFCDQIHNPEPDRANQQLRLESDENLVRIITIHKAKGLEYPIVFLPYLWRTRPIRSDLLFTFHDPASGRMVADLGTGDPEHYRLAERERLAEDLRLLYVAVTRARHMCCFCWGRIKEMESTPLAWLLHRQEGGDVPAVRDMDEGSIVNALSGLNRTEQLVAYLPCPTDFNRKFAAGAEEQKQLRPRIFTGRIDAGWSVTSYSQLAAFTETRELRYEFPPAEEGGDAAGEQYTPYSFPRGAAAGNCLHGLLEKIDPAVVQGREAAEIITRHLVKSGIDDGWTPMVCNWLQDVVNTPLTEDSDIRLSAIGPQERLAELGFYFSMHETDIREINRVLTEFSVPTLDTRSVLVNGLMKGYIDLVFTYEGKFYIADYKSNYLGPAPEDYRQEKLAEAMGEHRYDLQYLIYTVALHRYLGTRIPDYCYENHLGGVFYLFLRGMSPATGADIGVFCTLPPAGLIDRLDRCFGYPEVENAPAS